MIVELTDELVDRIAEAAHEVNRAYCLYVTEDYSQAPWEALPDDLKNSTRNGVRAVADDPRLSLVQCHNLWMKQKVKEGWIYDPHKNYLERKHPNIVEYERLPLEQRVKDALFGTIVRTMLHLEFDLILRLNEDYIKTDPGRKPHPDPFNS